VRTPPNPIPLPPADTHFGPSSLLNQDASTAPERLFKYMPYRFVDGFIRCGWTLFRNLSYFRSLEGDRVRGDLYEGSHIDRPGNISITIARTGRTVTGDFAFVNAIRREHIFVFCLSTKHDPELYRAFEADACVEITDPTQWLQECQRASAAISWPGSTSFSHGAVDYYKQAAPARGNIKDPRQLSFFKPESYSAQAEYRVVVADPLGLQLKERIVMGHALEQAEAAKSERPRTRWVRFRGRRPYMIVHRSTLP
jgi:hypothetical protein